MATAIPAKLNNEELLVKLKERVALERHAIVEVLNYLREIENRKLHLARGYSSMFAFCTEYLGYSESEAHIRIQAMRLSNDLPQVTQQIELGQMSLTVAAMAQTEFRRENKRRKQAGAKTLRREEKAQVLAELESSSKREAQKVLAQHFPQATNTTKMSFDATAEQLAKIELFKGLVAHKNFDGDLAKLVELAMDIAIKEVQKSKPSEARAEAQHKNDTAVLGPDQVQTNSQPKSDSAKLARPTRSRFINIKMKRDVWRQAGGRCQFIDPVTGRRCESRHGLEIDHIQEFAKGGGHQRENLRLLCSAHNKFRNDRNSQISSLPDKAG